MAMRAAGRAMRAEQPQTELTSTMTVPGLSFNASSTSSAVRSSVKPTSVRSRRIGTRKRSSYIMRAAAGDPECVIFSSRRSVLISFFLVFDFILVIAPQQREDRALGDDEIRVTFERDFDGRLPEKQRVVAHLCLHGHEAVFARPGAPWLVAHLRWIGHRQTRTRGDDLPTLHRLAVHRRWRQVEPDLRALLAFLRLHQDPIADDDQLLLWHG